MNKNPYINAIIAGAYIATIVLVINFFGSTGEEEKSLLIPMTMLSLLVFSVALMGYLFVYEPLRLLMNNQKDEAVSFFFKTLGTFALIIILFAVTMLLTSQ